MRAVYYKNLFQYLAAFSGSFNLISYGVVNGWSSPFLPYLTSESSTIPVTNEQGSWIAVMGAMGCPLGAILGSYLGDTLGRKKSVLMVAPIAFLGNIWLAFANDIWMLFAIRFIIGLADGFSFTVFPVYIGEISSPEIRGFLSSLPTLMFLFGILFINIIGSIWSISICAIISSIIPLLHLITFIFMPESPYWYIKVKRYDDAEKSLQILRGENDVKKQLMVIKETIREEEERGKPKFTDLITVPSNRRATIITFLIVLQNKSSAKSPLLFFTKTIFEKTGSDISPTVSTISYSAVEMLIAALTCFFILDRFGKRILCIISTTGCIITLLAIGIYFQLDDMKSELLAYLNWLPLTALILYNIFYNVGISFAPFCFACELFPTGVRANALTMTELSMSICTVISGKAFHWLESYYGSFAIPFFTFSFLSLFVFVFVIKLTPETKGKSLEEIQLFLKSKTK
ncbi:facilitated trehalose transporter Tret1-like [Diabrotica undecimpunctata]|uniref:facilitated trehalose transporter Tret1-like n=1 Tax=Diabrotica undecimpunctata TaxID=50387 RepID=UPI003B642394